MCILFVLFVCCFVLYVTPVTADTWILFAAKSLAAFCNEIKLEMHLDFVRICMIEMIKKETKSHSDLKILFSFFSCFLCFIFIFYFVFPILQIDC